MPNAAQNRAIKDIALATGLSEHTLRYYERIGLMVPVDRNESGHRIYDDHAVEWVMLLTHLRETGMSIQEMQRSASLVKQGPGTEPMRLELLEHHLHSLDEQIQNPQRARWRSRWGRCQPSSMRDSSATTASAASRRTD